MEDAFKPVLIMEEKLCVDAERDFNSLMTIDPAEVIVFMNFAG